MDYFFQGKTPSGTKNKKYLQKFVW